MQPTARLDLARRLYAGDSSTTFVQCAMRQLAGDDHHLSGNRDQRDSSRRMAQHADKFSLIRSVYHTATAVEHTGHWDDADQQGSFTDMSYEQPHAGCVLGPVAQLAARRTPRTCFCQGRWDAPGGNLPHGIRRPDTSASRTTHSGTQRRPVGRKTAAVPDLLPPDYIRSVRGERRQKLRDAIDGVCSRNSRTTPRPNNWTTPFTSLIGWMSSPSARGVRRRVVQELDLSPRPLRPHAIRAELSSGPAADRGGQGVPLRHFGQHVSKPGVRRNHLGHSRLETVHGHSGNVETGRARIFGPGLLRRLLEDLRRSVGCFP